jgi:pyruvate dehydrogenase E2 component (dihydrolipoamide acetyltransferase)
MLKSMWILVLLGTIRYDRETHRPGDVFEVEAKEGERLCALGVAQEVDAPALPEGEASDRPQRSDPSDVPAGGAPDAAADTPAAPAPAAAAAAAPAPKAKKSK